MNISPLLSIVFPNFNGKNDCRVLLNSIPEIGFHQKDVEVIMIDNNSTDGSVEFVGKHFPKVIIIKSPKNLGPGAARNMGIKKSTGEYIMCTDNDVRFDNASLSTLINILKSRPEVGIVGGKILKKKDGKLVSAGFRFNRFIGIENGNSTPEKETDVDWLGAAFMVFSRTLIDKVGLFDERFFLYAEDADFCLNAKAKGYQVLYSPTASVYHGKENNDPLSVTKKDYYRYDYFQYYKSKFMLIKKHSNLGQQLTSCLFHLTIAIPARLIFGKPENPILKYKAFSEGFR